jgi:hypothetical protein
MNKFFELKSHLDIPRLWKTIWVLLEEDGWDTIDDYKSNPKKNHSFVAISIPTGYLQYEEVHIPFEVFLSLCFPLLFPNGPLHLDDASTIKQKVQVILQSHPWFRSGALAEMMIRISENLHSLKMQTSSFSHNLQLRDLNNQSL